MKREDERCGVQGAGFRFMV